jgi:hypothetical protein
MSLFVRWCFHVVPFATSCPPHDNRTAEPKQLDDGIGGTFVSGRHLELGLQLHRSEVDFCVESTHQSIIRTPSGIYVVLHDGLEGDRMRKLYKDVRFETVLRVMR